MGSGFHHEAVFYGSDQEYVAGLLPDLRAATTVLVAVSEAKGALLRGALGADADRVRFADMEALGRNPACIIPAWREFLADAAPGPVLGIGEPVWPGNGSGGRTPRSCARSRIAATSPSSAARRPAPSPACT